MNSKNLTNIKKKIAFIDHSFHKKTKTSEFFKDILKKKYNIVEFFDHSWDGGDKVDISEINKNNFEIIVYWQFIHSPKDLKKIKCKHVIWIPMLDAEIERNYFKWLKYLILNIKIISFSKELYERVDRIGFNCVYFQYFPNPHMLTDRGQTVEDKINIFFWQRVNKINWSLIKVIIGNNDVDKIIFKNNCDPGHNSVLPEKDEIKKYNIQFIDGWMLINDGYLKFLSSCNIFFAPRKYEGIGMGFLEAMAIGICVIAPNNSTMNEYITHGENGYLYNPAKPEKVNFSDAKIIGEKAKRYIESGYEKWTKRKDDVIVFVENPVIKLNNIKLFYFSLSIYLYDILIIPYKGIKRIKKFIKL